VRGGPQASSPCSSASISARSAWWPGVEDSIVPRALGFAPRQDAASHTHRNSGAHPPTRDGPFRCSKPCEGRRMARPLPEGATPIPVGDGTIDDVPNDCIIFACSSNL
jgi:hypothetical protein